MSFGASPSDIIAVVAFCKILYRKCKDAGGEYDEISREVKGLYTVLRHLKYEVQAPDSPLYCDSVGSRQLEPIIGNCDFTLRQLDGLLQRYGRLGADGGGNPPPSPRVSWDKVRLGSDEMDELGAIRVKLISHKTSLTLFLDTIQLHESGKMSTTLDNHEGQLDVILDKVDSIATRMGQKSGGSVMSHDNDDKEVWKQFRRELESEGFSSSVLQQHKDVLRAYIREIDQKGLLDDMPQSANPDGPSQGVDPHLWLENAHTGPSVDTIPSFDLRNTPMDDSRAKEMVIREDNMKFPQFMKMERLQPQIRRGLGLLQQPVVPAQRIPISAATPAINQNVQPQPFPVLLPETPNDKGIQYHNTSGSSDDDSKTDNSSKRSISRSKGALIRTSDLLALSRALQVQPSGSPQSVRSQNSIGEDDARRSIAYRPKEQSGLASSPPRAGAISIPSANPISSTEHFGTSPRPYSSRLAPDSYGNEIPSDAKWTKMARRLVSPEVLDQDRRRYEARPDFVAVLGVLSRDEIEDYAVRSQILRAARTRRSRPIQAPSKAPRSAQRAPERRGGRDTPSTDEEDQSSDSDHHKSKHRSKASRSYTPSNISSTIPRSAYPAPFGSQPPPSPMSPPSSMSRPGWTSEPPRMKSGQGGHSYTYSPSKEKEKEQEKQERESSRRNHRSSSRHSHSSHSSHPKNKSHKEGKSHWKESVTAAGIGGAAASLLSVLAEAARTCEFVMNSV
ncbi:hypothetical protein LOCC1_G006371 [Lachnellula occidentalis]|uniref:DUF8035 domain-containing protein n=1 Tax=Lachnellula occidentalis TaxID=215460 RepID=A0A8H8U8N9_9HELO|nr:hypothetical protein LOCC1_G006371 [Lachnellula occidentalis]